MCIISMIVCRVFPGKFGCNSAGEGKLTNFKFIAVSSGILALIAYVSGTFWYLSLPRTRCVAIQDLVVSVM